MDLKVVKLFKFLLLQKSTTKFKCFNPAVNTQFLLEESDENKFMALIMSKKFPCDNVVCGKIRVIILFEFPGFTVIILKKEPKVQHRRVLRIKKKPKIQHSRCFKNKKINPKFNIVELKKNKK